MRSIYLSDFQNRDHPVGFEPVSPESDVHYAQADGGRAISVKLIKTTFPSRYAAVADLAETKGAEIADLLIEGDPEIDFNYSGKISSRTKTIYLDDQEQIAYNVAMREDFYKPDGELEERRAQDRRPSNINTDAPLVLSKKRIPLAKALRAMVFTKIYQIRHTTGLTFDFLYQMATELDERREMALVGAGPTGKEPLRFTRGGPQYRAFLAGKVKGDTYRLTLHLTNLELKDLSDAD